MILQVEIKDNKASDLIAAINLLSGVKSVKAQGVLWDKSDKLAYTKAKKELKNGKAISLKSLKKELGL